MKRKIAICILLFILQFALQANASTEQVSKVSEKELVNISMIANEASLIEVEIKDEIYSLFLQVVGQKDVHYYFEKVIDPDGKIILGEIRSDITIGPNDLADNPLINLKLSENPSAGPVITEAAAILIPNRPSVKMVQGKWKFWVRTTESNISQHEIKVRSFIKTLSQKSDDNVIGIVPLNLYFNGAAGLTAQNFKDNKYFDVFYKQLKKSLATAGLVPQIQLAEDITFPKSLNPSTLDRSLISNTDLKQNNGINLIFTSFRGAIGGISFGLPSPLLTDGFIGAILVGVPLDNMMSGLTPETLVLKFNRSGAVAAHEIGHYLGLFHVCEAGSRLLEDGLSDTKCEPNSNVMTREVSAIGPFSEQQRKILIRNPLIPLFITNEGK